MSHLFLTAALSSTTGSTAWCARLCAELCGTDGTALESFATSIRAEGRKIAAEATGQHGITSAQAERGGIYELFALGAICGLKAGPRRASDYPGLASNARFVIGWNMDLLRAVIGNAFARHGEPAGAWVRPGLSFISLKQYASPWCFMEPVNGIAREPTIAEACAALLGESPAPGPSSADADLRRVKALYARLLERKAFEHEVAA